LGGKFFWDENDNKAFRFRTYATNNGDIYWFGWLERGSEGQRKFDRSQGALARYAGSRGVETCPSLNYDFAKFKLKATGAAYGYGYNLNLSAALNQPAFIMSGLRLPSQTALLADAAQVNTFQAPASAENPMLEEFYYVSEKEPTAHFRHTRLCDSVFCDGHAEGLQLSPGSQDTRLPSVRVGRIEDQFLLTP
jgi:hypothetical protein